MPRKETKKDPERLLMIKAKTCQRLLKEVAYYKQEVLENEEKLESMKSGENSNPYDVKRFRQVLDESYMMVPDSTKRLNDAFEDLQKFLEEEEDSKEISKDNEWLKVANDLLQEHTGPAASSEHREPMTSVESLAEGEAF